MASENDEKVLNCILNPLLPMTEINYEEKLPNSLKDNEELTETVIKAKEVEADGVRHAEKGNLKEALQLFDKAIEIEPTRASGYNNRAQLYRLLFNEKMAKEDLDKAIELSNGMGRSGCHALCQRGLLYRKQGEMELAKSDYTKAANLGSQFARQQLVELNPYAAMCNQMLHEVVSKLYSS